MKLVVCSSGMYRVCLWQLSEPTPATSSAQEQPFPLEDPFPKCILVSSTHHTCFPAGPGTLPGNPAGVEGDRECVLLNSTSQ